MKKVAIIAAALLLCGCGQSAPDVSSSPESSVSEIKSDFRIVKPEEVTQGRRDKMSIESVYVLERKEDHILVIDYLFLQCFSNEPASFGDSYNDSVYINGIEAEHYYGDIEGSEANYDSKLLSMARANIKVGYKIKDYEAVKDKDFRLFLNLKDGAVMYEIEGVISNLQVEKG